MNQRLVALLAVGLAVGACAGMESNGLVRSESRESGGPTPSSVPIATASSERPTLSTASPEPRPSDVATTVPGGSPPALATVVPAGSPFPIDSVVVTIEDRVRLRSKPEVSESSVKFEPTLPLGTALYVLGGPVAGSGYIWYEVVPLTANGIGDAWVAAGSRSGLPWLASGRFPCPPIPADLRTLRGLPYGVGLACFAQTPITVRAQISDCNCDIDWAVWFTPNWFTSETLLVEPTDGEPPSIHESSDWFPLYLDPAGEFPDPLPIREYLGGTSWSDPGTVEITGMFDHPAAAGCTLTEMDSQPEPSNGCRLKYAVTKIEVISR